MICQHCGAPLENGLELCPFCGSPTPYEATLLDEKIRRKQEAQRKKMLDGLSSMKHVSGFSLPFLYIVTMGLYGPLWYLMRVGALNRLTSSKKLPLLPALLHLAAFLGLWILPNMEPAPEYFDLLYRCCFSTTFFLSIWLALRVRGMLQSHAAQYLEKSVAVRAIAPSVVLLVLLGPLYLQTQVNKMMSMELLTASV